MTEVVAAGVPEEEAESDSVTVVVVTRGAPVRVDVRVTVVRRKADSVRTYEDVSILAKLLHEKTQLTVASSVYV